MSLERPDLVKDSLHIGAYYHNKVLAFDCLHLLDDDGTVHSG